MTLRQFKEFCEAIDPKEIIYTDENNREYIPRYDRHGKVSNPMKLDLVFDSIMVSSSPDCSGVFLHGKCGYMYFVCAKRVEVMAHPLGTVATVYCENVDYRTAYTVILR